jgi:DNA-binding CsgD family transcriptional regulator
MRTRTTQKEPSVPIVGRGPELDAIMTVLSDVRAGLGRQVVIEGEPGIGKTRLAAEITDRLAVDFHVFRARGAELDHDRPFGLVVDALGGDHDATIAGLLRASGEGSADHRHRIVDAVEDAFEREAMQRPLVLLLEDVHWADHGSILALHRLTRRDDLPICTVVTCRPVPRPDELRRVFDGMVDAGGLHLQLQPLDDDAVFELAQADLGANPGPLLRSQLARTAGNPLFVLELLGGLVEENLIEWSAGVAETHRAVEPPPSLRTVIIRRLGFLGRDSLELLRTASVLGESFSAADLATATNMPLADVLKTLEDPLAAGFVAADADAFTFRHDVVREALYTDIAPAVRKAMHLHVGRALAASGAPTIRVAEHVALGAEVGDRQAVSYLRDAAFEVASRDPVTAAELARRAADLLPAEDADRVTLLMPAVQQLTRAGRIEDSAALATELAPLLDGSPLEIVLDFERMNHLVVQMRVDELAEYARRLLEDRSLPEVYRMYAITLAVGVRAMLQEPAALQEMDEVRPFAAANPESGPAAMCSWIDGYNAWMHGRFAEAAGHFERAVPGTSVFPGGVGQGLALAGAAQGLVDRMAEAFDTFEAARRELEQRGMVQYMIEHHWLLGAVLFVAGRWDDALAELAASRQLARETGAAGTASVVPDPTPLIHAFRGDATAARQALESAACEPALSSGLLTDWTSPIRVVVSESAGDRADANETLLSWRKAMDDYGFVPDFRTTGRMLVRVARRMGDERLLGRLREAATVALDAAGGVKSVEGAALHVAGAVAGDCEMLLAAVEAARTGGRPFDIAEACAEAAHALLRSGDRTAGLALLEEAFGRYDELGARNCVAALDREVRDLGIRRGARRPRVGARFGWESLTETERRVVACLAEGLTNGEIGQRLYISKTTVASHLRSVFRKVGVSSRTELAAENTRRVT